MKVNYTRKNYWVKKSTRLQTWTAWFGIAAVASLAIKVIHSKIVAPEEIEVNLGKKLKKLD
jgi:hypothetical protein